MYGEDCKAFYDACIDFFYDDYFKGEEGHEDWTDDQISMSVQKDDIEICLLKMRDALTKHFGYDENEITLTDKKGEKQCLSLTQNRGE